MVTYSYEQPKKPLGHSLQISMKNNRKLIYNFDLTDSSQFFTRVVEYEWIINDIVESKLAFFPFKLNYRYNFVVFLIIVNNAAQGILSSFFFKFADTILKKYMGKDVSTDCVANSLGISVTQEQPNGVSMT